MRLRSAAWFAFLWLTLPLAAVGGQLFLGSTFPTGTGYGMSENIRAYGALVLIAPVVALGGALTGGRLRRSGLLQHWGPHRRGASRVWFNLAALPVVAFSALLWALMASAAASSGSSYPLLDPRLAVAAALQSAAYVLLGLALGSNLPSVMAVPVALVLPYVLIAFPPALSTYWIRHVTGISNNCCWIYEDLPSRALGAHLAFSLSLALAAAAALPAWNARANVTRALLLTLASVSLLTAFLSAQIFGPSASESRAGAPDCSSASGVELCLWSEHEKNRSEAEQVLQRILSQAAGVDIPDRFTELDPGLVRWPSSSWDASSGSREKLLAGAVSALFPATQCTEQGTSGLGTASPQQGPDDGPIVRAWWSGRLGLDVEEALTAGGATEEQRESLAKIVALTLPEQKDAINTLVQRAARVCSGTVN